MAAAGEIDTGGTSSGAGAVDVLVAVVTYNSADVVGDLLASLPDGLEGCSWRLVVADNDSQDATVALVRDVRPDALVVETGYNAGYAAGINAAVAAGGQAASVLAINADARLVAGSVAAMLLRLRRRGVGIVVPQLLNSRGLPGQILRREPTIARAAGDMMLGAGRAGRFPMWGERVIDPDSYTRETAADWAAGTAMLVSRECLDACGDWDASFFLYSEETEFCLRARDRGFALVLAPDAEVVHVGGESRVSPTLRALLVVNRIRLYRRSHSAFATTVFWLIAVLREASRVAMGQRISRQALLTLLDPRRARDVARHAAGLLPDVDRRHALTRGARSALSDRRAP